jgi:hypothetical protein
VDKFGRRYQLQVGTESGSTLTVELPFTIEFDITRNTLTSANVCQVRIYNLSQRNRNQLRRNVTDYGDYRPITLKAGYGDNLATIFTGNVTQAWSVREGVNFITQIECFDGGFAFVNGKTNAQFPANTSQRDVIRTLASSLPYVKLGAIGDYPGSLSRGNSYSGNTTDILRELTGGGFFIDNGKANALNTDEYIETVSPPLVINSKSGLLGTPVLEKSIVRFDMLFEPSLNVGYRIKLESLTEVNFNADSNFNGIYKVTSVKHRGMISEAVCGSVITTGEFFFTKLGLGVR